MLKYVPTKTAVLVIALALVSGCQATGTNDSAATSSPTKPLNYTTEYAVPDYEGLSESEIASLVGCGGYGDRKSPSTIKRCRPWAEKGFWTPQYNMALAYIGGWGGEQNLVKALKWLILAYRNATTLAGKTADLEIKKALLEAMSRVKQHMSSSEIQAAEIAASDWRPTPK
jgi:hypothetical protein